MTRKRLYEIIYDTTGNGHAGHSKHDYGRLFVRGKREASRVAAALIAAGYSVRTHQANDERQAYWNQRLHPSDVIAAHRREETRRRCEELVNDRCREELEEELYRERVLAWHPELEEEDLNEGDAE